MRFTIPKLNISINNFIRQCGYVQISNPHKNGEISYARNFDAGSFYPRLHLYIEEGTSNNNFSLHLDMKKPSYEGASAHSGEYGGELVEAEAKRIKAISEKFLSQGFQIQPLGFKPRKNWLKKLFFFLKK